MDKEQIEKRFWEAIAEKAVNEKLTGISEDKIYNWRHNRGKGPSVGDMLGVLFELNLIIITAQP